MPVGMYIGLAFLWTFLCGVLIYLGEKQSAKEKRRAETSHNMGHYPLPADGHTTGTPTEISAWLGVTRPRELPRAMVRVAAQELYGTYRRPLAPGERLPTRLERILNVIPAWRQLRLRNPFFKVPATGTTEHGAEQHEVQASGA